MQLAEAGAHLGEMLVHLLCLPNPYRAICYWLGVGHDAGGVVPQWRAVVTQMKRPCVFTVFTIITIISQEELSVSLTSLYKSETQMEVTSCAAALEG